MDAALLAWYRPRRTRYPWRRARPDPYHVLVSEFMLQQTQAARVVPAFRSFVARFPTVEALAGASRRDVLEAWSGLGYNRRAVRIREAARRIAAEHGGVVPSDPAVLAMLPGTGPYTAAAVASIAFGVTIPAVDTNVRRVVARAVLGVDGNDAPIREVRRAASAWMDRTDPGAWNQAVMDLGREVCRPVPRCSACPLAPGCAFRRRGAAGRRPPKIDRSRLPAAPFEGSARQLRGAIVRILIDRPVETISSLSRATGRPPGSVAQIVGALAAEGLLRAGPAALAGNRRGRVRLAP